MRFPGEFQMNCSVKLVVGKDKPAIGPGLVSLLEEIAGSSSVMDACSRMDISYSKAWKLIRQAEECLGEQLVLRKSGGSRGGAAELTGFAKGFIKNFRKTEKQLSSYAQRTILKNFAL